MYRPPVIRRARTFLCLLVVLLLGGGSPAKGTMLPAGFREKIVFSNLFSPTAVAFSPDGRVFVAEKSGVIKVFDDLSHPQPHVLADLRTEVYNGGDRGLLGLALDPGFPQRPYLYVLYTYDAPIGGTAPFWGTAGEDFDPCPDPPGFTTDGCVVSGRLARLTVSGDSTVGPEHVLLNDWCQQFPSHSIGHLAFGADGALYASGGDGSSYDNPDYGQFGQPINPCGDPPAGMGGAETPPTAEGGSLRSQDLRTPGDPTGLDGSLIRIDPDTGAALPTNPLASSPDPNARRIVAYGFRNPFRFAIRPGTNDVWLGNVGMNTYEAIDRVPDPTGSAAPYNFGWPCYEGTSSPGVPWRQPEYDSADLNICNGLYADPAAVTPAYFSYQHGQPVVQGEDCSAPRGSAISSLAFYSGSSYPASYHGALFFGDYARGCIWVMAPGANGLPDPSQVSVFAHDPTSSPDPVDLEPGPGGDLYWVDIIGGTLRRIQYFAGNQPPIADLQADATEGPVPLTVKLDATGSSDPDSPDPVSYAWDLNDDGQFGDSTSATPTVTFDSPGPHTVSLEVTDSHGATDVAATVIHAGNTSPVATITAPDPNLHWSVGDKIQLEGTGADAENGPLQPGNLSWTVQTEHCPTGPDDCHLHPLTGFTGAAGTITAPDHDYPSRLLIELTATDAGNLTDTATRYLSPATHTVTLNSEPRGIDLGLGSDSGPTPRSKTVISRSQRTVSAPSTQTLDGVDWQFDHWSDGGSRLHTITANQDIRLTATYAAAACMDNPPPMTTLQAVTVHSKRVVIRGAASDPACEATGLLTTAGQLASVNVYLARMTGGECRFLRSSRGFGPNRPCTDPSLLAARGTETWRRTLRRHLPPGHYLVGALATDDLGSSDTPGPGNETTFRVRRPTATEVGRG